MTERSAGNDTNTSSEPMDGSAGGPKRYAHGSEIGEALVASGTQDDADAFLSVLQQKFNPPEKWNWHVVLDSQGVVFTVKWNAEAKADAATSTQEEGIPTS